MAPRAWVVAGLLFASGLCALIYQTVWMRELRLVFGASTAASAAVLAILMADSARVQRFSAVAATRTRGR